MRTAGRCAWRAVSTRNGRDLARSARLGWRPGGRWCTIYRDFDLGFTTAIELYGAYEAAVAYVCKYISKGLGGGDGSVDYVPLSGKIGGRWYYSGGDLRGPEVSYCDVACEELAAAGGRLVSLTDAHLMLCILRGRYDDFWRGWRPGTPRQRQA